MQQIFLRQPLWHPLILFMSHLVIRQQSAPWSRSGLTKLFYRQVIDFRLYVLDFQMLWSLEMEKELESALDVFLGTNVLFTT